jgi:hypothetical protein
MEEGVHSLGAAEARERVLAVPPPAFWTESSDSLDLRLSVQHLRDSHNYRAAELDRFWDHHG